MIGFTTVVGLILWFVVLRWLFRLGLKHPKQTMLLLRGAKRMLSK